MANYAKSLPRDTGGAAMQEYPAPLPALRQYQRETGAAVSSVINLHPAASHIEIGAQGGGGVSIRWVPVTETAGVGAAASVIASGLTANFDHWIPPSQYRRFVIPKETQGSYAGQVGSVNGLYQRLAWVNASTAVSSIISSEF